ncbi:S8 family peptidase [Pseudoduganella violaceinigra]|uniref:S8 family peptidase n=1 Tax=Pseudoduganella violaceinigra TaxID=246602 RepID=UPI0003F86F17|nr:S8 family peptidase [Pseudoduganella violaceinigra]
MPDRPILKLPEPVDFQPHPGPPGRKTIETPTRDRQRDRLAPRFARLMQIAGNPHDLLALRADPASIAPERAIVFEVAGQLKDFYQQAQNLGIEYLGDYEVEIESGADFSNIKKPGQSFSGRVYLAMPDVRALQELLGLWRRFQNGRMPSGRGEWGTLFSLLVDIRPWGPQDRVPPETIEYWREELAASPGAPVRFEVEMWFHERDAMRTAALARVRDSVERMGGRVVHHAEVADIRYHAALVDIPAAQAQQLIDHPDIELARIDDIMFLRPQSVGRPIRKEERDGDDFGGVNDESPLPAGEPLAALLDGFPVQNHIRLAGRIIIDDPDGLEARYPVNRRGHGTEMASLIVHGDLSNAGTPLTRPIVVHPVMQPDNGDSEHTLADQLLVDVIHRAVRRIKVGNRDDDAIAPSVVLFNLSIGDRWRPFARLMSPLARLLDDLAYRYRVLFLVSAGNVGGRLRLPRYENSIAFEAADPAEREKEVLAALDSEKSQRTLLSPAESVNALTIGAAHKSQAFNGLPANLIDPYDGEGLPNIMSAMGLGYRKSIKPDLLFAGGRLPVRVVASGQGVTIEPVVRQTRLFGLKAAAPDAHGSIRREDFTVGTSAATALATRAGHQILEVLVNEAEGSNHADLPVEFRALAAKALLVHGASWGGKGEMLDEHLQPRGVGSHVVRRDDISRLLGFGMPDIERVIDCTENRATLLGIGTITPGKAWLYRIPIPGGLEGQRAFRALTTTLVWFTPTNPRHQGYRRVSLDISPGTDEKYWITTTREAPQPTDKAVVRGSVFHERRFGENAAVFVDDGHLLLRISCRATAGEFNEAVPYAICISFEVGIETGIQVYEEIRQRITPQVPIVQPV